MGEDASSGEVQREKPSREPNMGLDPARWGYDISQREMLNRLSDPVPPYFYFKINWWIMVGIPNKAVKEIVSYG